MTPEQAQALRKPFDARVIGKLPKSSCRDCSQSQRKRCDRHQWVSNCPECHGSHTSAAIHLDYVGHAATTDRLLSVDPGWSWEPLGLDERGLPALDRSNNLWIRLTVAGVTRIGVGDGKSAKECIGDAIRNAAMRFGVALDLWGKEELEQADGPAVPVQTSGAGAAPEQAPPPVEPTTTPAPEGTLLNTRSALAKAMYAGINDLGIADDERIPFIVSVIDRKIASTREMTKDEARLVLGHIDDVKEPEAVDAEVVES